MNAVSIAHDYGGLKRATLELLEEARMEPQRQRAERMAEYAANAEEILAGTAPRKTMADGYYARISYLLELEAIVRLGAGLATLVLDLSEMHGLTALAAARIRFDELHPPCRKCGVRLENEGERTCAACWQAEAAAAR
jgi:hypothetical protein